MSLADRLAQARRERASAAGPSNSAQAGIGARPWPGPGARPALDPFAELKREVHQSLLETLGPKLYDAG